MTEQEDKREKTKETSNDASQEQSALTPQEQSEQYSFMNERVKAGPLNRKKFLRKAAQTLALGLIFGLGAGVVICALSPWISNHIFSRNTGEEVTIPEDTKEETSVDETSSSETSGEEQSTGAPVVLSADNYSQLLSSLDAVASKARHSMVTMTGLRDGEDKFNSMYVNPQKASGVIIAETQTELYVLTPDSVLQDTTAVTVTFGDGASYDATLTMRDVNTGLAVFSIKLSQLSQETRDYYETAELGNSYSASSGTPIVLLGDLFGTDISQAYGIIASNEQEESRPDGKFKLLTSDVGGGEQSSGVFLNTKGEVVGFIIPESSSGSSSAICAYPISDIKKVIENLSNGTPVPYIGIYGIDVSTEMAKEQGLKEGIYVSRTALDSPAMAAGLQSGDIIQEVDGQSIRTLNAFRASLFNHAEGDVVEIKVQRPGKESYLSVTCTVTIGSLTQQ